MNDRRRLLTLIKEDDMKPLFFNSSASHCDLSNYEGPVSSAQEFLSKYILYYNQYIYNSGGDGYQCYSSMPHLDAVDSGSYQGYLKFISSSIPAGQYYAKLYPGSYDYNHIFYFLDNGSIWCQNLNSANDYYSVYTP